MMRTVGVKRSQDSSAQLRQLDQKAMTSDPMFDEMSIIIRSSDGYAGSRFVELLRNLTMGRHGTVQRK